MEITAVFHYSRNMTTDKQTPDRYSRFFVTKEDALEWITSALDKDADSFNLEAVFAATFEYDEANHAFVQVVDVKAFWQVIELCAIDTELNS